MSEPYPIIDVTTWPAAGDEALGTKPKVWLAESAERKWLFKGHRPNTGGDWAEKIAAEVAELLGLPHATVELANRNGTRGIISRSLVDDARGDALVHGNSLLFQDDPQYPMAGRYHVPEHTIDRVFAKLAESFLGLPAGVPEHPAIASPPDLFLGYLLFDTLIGNSDRHHENWAVIVLAGSSERAAILCPTYDHASCLAHNLLDAEREERLKTKDKNRTVEAYVRSGKSRSALYANASDPRPLSPLSAFRTAALLRPDAGRFWLERLALLDANSSTDIVDRVPNAIMNPVTKRFAVTMMSCNRTELLALVPL